MNESISPDETGYAPEQKIIDPLTGRNITGEYAAEKRRELEARLREVFLEIAIKAFNREPAIPRPVMGKALKYHKKYFQAMKGATNLHTTDIKEAVAREVERQDRFYSALAGLAAEFKKAGAQFEILPPDKGYQDSYWDTGLVTGCNIKTGNAYLCAFPLVPARTTCYMALVQEPVAAQVVFVSEDCMVLAPLGQDFGEDFLKASERLFGKRKDVKGDFPEAIVAYLGNNFLCVDTGEDFTSQRLKELKAKYGVIAIIKGGANFIGYIFTGKEDKLSVFFKESFEP